MKMKRGTDHWWEVRRYKGDAALYAHCKCGFQYHCSSTIAGPGVKQEINYIYLMINYNIINVINY